MRRNTSSHYNVYINTDYVIFVPLSKVKRVSNKFMLPFYAGGAIGGAAGGLIIGSIDAARSKNSRKKTLEELKDKSIEYIKQLPDAVGTYRNQVTFTKGKHGIDIVIGYYTFIVDKDTADKLQHSIAPIK